LLWLLASNPNQVFTNSRLLSLIWQNSFKNDENTTNDYTLGSREKN